MKALLLAAGLGTRLRPITDKTPKCLVPINGVPLLGYWLKNLQISGVSEVLINTHYLNDQVEQFIKSQKLDIKIHVSFESKLLGTAGTLNKHLQFAGDDGLLVLHADNFCEHLMSDFILKHQQRPAGCIASLLGFRTTRPEYCGIMVVNDRQIVTEWHEKVFNPPGNLASCAVSIFDQEMLTVIKNEFAEATDIARDILPFFVGQMQAVETSHFFADIGTLQALQMTRKHANKSS